MILDDINFLLNEDIADRIGGIGALVGGHMLGTKLHGMGIGTAMGKNQMGLLGAVATGYGFKKTIKKDPYSPNLDPV
jgi:outer membrane lipoprotein SlyB